MNAQNSLDLLREIKDVAFATVSENGTPYRIIQEHCLHCGLCFENCPVTAIERIGK